MSEQTPDTENGMADGQDPSMEDILASIRKIIAEDDIQTTEAPDAVIAEVVPDAPNLSGDVSEMGHVGTLDLDIIADEAPAIDPDIDALIGDMDATASDKLAPAIAATASSGEESLDDILNLEIPMDENEILAELETPDAAIALEVPEPEPLSLEDETIDLVAEPEDEDVEQEPKISVMEGALAAMGLGGVAAATTKDAESSEGAEADAGDDLSLMLDNMLEDNDSDEEVPTDSIEDRVVDPAEGLVVENEAGEELLAELDFVEDSSDDTEVISNSDPDMDLVKSLMADLSDTPLHDDVEISDDEVEVPVIDINDESDLVSDDIVDEILSVTIDDETKLSEEVAISEVETPSIDDVASEGLSLKDIAAAAEADAKASDGGLSTGLVAGLGAAAVGAVAATTLPEDTSEDETPEDALDETDTILTELDNVLAEEIPAETTKDLTPEAEILETPEIETPEPPIEETPDMARAKKTDAIIDEVTETATAGAFASLSNVVEEKATVAERGDRIGDIVMEALQPMLKEWLDANLKGIVERAVTKEVKRISSGK